MVDEGGPVVTWKLCKNTNDSPTSTWITLINDFEAVPSREMHEASTGALIILNSGYSSFEYSPNTNILSFSLSESVFSGGYGLYSIDRVSSGGIDQWYAVGASGRSSISSVALPVLTSDWIPLTTLDLPSRTFTKVKSDGAINGTVIAITSEMRILRSVGQSNWTTVKAYNPSDLNADQLLHAGNSTWLVGNYSQYANGRLLYRSIDDGITWNTVDISAYLGTASTYIVKGFATNGTGHILMVVTKDETSTTPSTILSSGDYGATWIPDTDLVSIDRVQSIMFHEDEYVILTTNGKIKARKTWGVY